MACHYSATANNSVIIYFNNKTTMNAIHVLTEVAMAALFYSSVDFTDASH